ncbi:MAG TPA: sterol desaturase family protein [Burkholderiaceae bacterium]|nr:sterol desaturase family protein [Burkholderiaceae bacterium]HQR72073.1 sterol desaturase family protein [Burkholderiaceae bacterium]
MIDVLTTAFTGLQAWLFETCVQPLLYATGWMRFQETAYEATEWFLLGVIQIGVLYVVLRPLEALFPAERWTNRRAARVDVIYTLLQRLGVVPLALFLLLTPVFDTLAELLRAAGFAPFNLDALWPGVTDIALVTFLIYLVVFDFVDYWLHRGQHRFRWWWELHAVHHSQRQMSFWTDDRNHLLDDLIMDASKAAVALAIGITPAQFVLLIVATRMMQSLQHANLRTALGPLGRVIVSPLFHRRHHAIGYGHEGAHRGCNFAVLFPVWDVLFGTADFRIATEPTGIRDQLPPPAGSARDYGRGFWAQQWLALVRLATRRAPATVGSA